MHSDIKKEYLLSHLQKQIIGSKYQKYKIMNIVKKKLVWTKKYFKVLLQLCLINKYKSE